MPLHEQDGLPIRHDIDIDMMVLRAEFEVREDEVEFFATRVERIVVDPQGALEFGEERGVHIGPEFGGAELMTEVMDFMVDEFHVVLEQFEFVDMDHVLLLQSLIFQKLGRRENDEELHG